MSTSGGRAAARFFRRAPAPRMNSLFALTLARSLCSITSNAFHKHWPARPRRISMKIGTAALAAIVVGFASVASAQDKTVELKLSHWVPPSHPLQKAMKDWGSSIEKASGGTIKYKVFPAQQLRKAFDHYHM